MPVSEKLAGVLTPATLAVMAIAPVVVGSAVTCANPLLFVTAVAPDGKLAFDPAMVTVAPGTGLLLASFTTTTSGLANGVPLDALWPEPETTAMLAGVPVPVSEKLAGVATPATLAVMVSEPLLVGCAVTCAIPLLLVTAVAPDGKLTPVPANVTVAPGTGLLPVSFTTTTSGLVNGLPIGALWPEPETVATLAGDPAVPVSLKVAGVAAPATDAVMVRAPVPVGCAVT